MKKPATTTRMMQTPGGTNHAYWPRDERLRGEGVLQHHAPRDAVGIAEAQEADAASVMIAQPMAIAAVERRQSGRMLGAMCTNRMRAWLAPVTRAAST